MLASIQAAVIVAPPAFLLETEGLIHGHRRIAVADFEVKPGEAGLPAPIDEVIEKRGARALALGLLCNGKEQHFGFVSDGPQQGKAADFAILVPSKYQLYARQREDSRALRAGPGF